VAAFGGLIRNTVIVLLATAMGLLILLTVRSLIAVSSGDGAARNQEVASAPGEASAPAGPTTTVALGGGQPDGSVACFRIATESGGPFYVEVVDPGSEPAQLAVAVALVEPDGARQDRTVQLEPLPGGPLRGPVADSSGADRFVECTVTAVQRDQQVLLTGN
jgi:hypothetical protein